MCLCKRHKLGSCYQRSPSPQKTTQISRTSHAHRYNILDTARSKRGCRAKSTFQTIGASFLFNTNDNLIATGTSAQRLSVEEKTIKLAPSRARPLSTPPSSTYHVPPNRTIHPTSRVCVSARHELARPHGRSRASGLDRRRAGTREPPVCVAVPAASPSSSGCAGSRLPTPPPMAIS